MAEAPSNQIDTGHYRALWDEYVLLQGKIDKIGAFKFQIRGWFMTIVVAGIGSIIASGTSLHTILLLLPVSLLMWLLEHEQSLRGSQYGARCDQIEHLFRRYAPRGIPQTALPQVARRSRLSRTRKGRLTSLLRYMCRNSSTWLFGVMIGLVIILGAFVPSPLASNGNPAATTPNNVSHHSETTTADSPPPKLTPRGDDPMPISEKLESEIQQHLKDIGHPTEISDDDDVFSLEMRVDEFVDSMQEIFDKPEATLPEIVEELTGGLEGQKEAVDAATEYISIMSEWSYDDIPTYGEIESAIDCLTELLLDALSNAPVESTEVLDFD